MRITLNPSRPRRAKLHMEAAWHALFFGNGEVYTFKDFSVAVTIDVDGNVDTQEIEH